MVKTLEMKTKIARYETFYDDILLVYQGLIDKYKLSISFYDIESFMLYNNDFVLTFINNHGEIRSYIKYSGFIHDKTELNEAHRELKIEAEVESPENFWDPKQVLQWYNELTRLVLSSIEKCVATRKRFGLWH